MLDVASLAMRLWNEHRESAKLPDWEVVGLEVVEKDLRERRRPRRPTYLSDTPGRWIPWLHVTCHDTAFPAVAARARVAATELALATRATKDPALEAMADALRQDATAILAANGADVDAAAAAGTPEHLLDRLRLDESRLAAMARASGTWRGCPTRSARWCAARRSPTGCSCARCGCRSGSSGSSTRPGPTSPPTRPASASRAATPCCCGVPPVRCGRTPRSSPPCVARRLPAGLPEDVVQLVPGEGHESVKELMRARGLVDVLIPRGGAGLIASVVEESTVPVIETGVGNCHVYVDSAADLDMAERIVLNAKTHRTSVCNAAESLLVHADVAEAFVPRIVAPCRRPA